MRVTSKGQVTIPKHVRRRTGIRAGTDVEFGGQGSEIILTKTDPRRKRGASAGNEFADYLDRVTGVVDLGMTTDEFMELMRGE